jgi:hypothetical protein
LTRRLLVLGTVGSALVALGGSVVGTAPVGGLRPPDWLGYAAAYTGLTLLVGAWGWVGSAVLRGAGPGRHDLWRLLAAWSTPLVLGAPLYSRDVYSYVAQGHMAELGINPYLHGPVSLGPGPYLDAVSHIWTRTPAPYGPLFVGVASLVTRVLPTVTSAAFGMRLVALASLAVLAVLLPRLARQHGGSEALALWLGLLNPLVILHFVAGGHNDALMLALMVAGLVLAGDDRPFAGMVLCTLAAAVKAPALLAVAYIAADLVRSRDGWPARARTAAASAAAAGATFVVVTGVVGYGWGWISAIGTPGKVRSMLAPSTALGALLARLGVGTAGSATRMLGYAAGAVLLQHLFRQRHRFGPLWSLAVSLVVVVVLGPVIQPWYLLWGLVLLAAAGPGRFLPVAVWTSAVMPFLVQPNGTSAADVVLLVFLVATTVLTVLTAAGPSRLAVAAAEPG